MPPKRIHHFVGGAGVSIESKVTMSRDFDVSKEALARTFVAAHREPVAVVVSRAGRIERFYRHEDFLFLPLAVGKALPSDSISAEAPEPRAVSDTQEVEAETWLSERDADRTLLLTEQVPGQQHGYALTILQAELDDEE